MVLTVAIETTLRLTRLEPTPEPESTVAMLMERAEAIRVQELDRLIRLLPGLQEDYQDTVIAFSKAIVCSILDQPVSSLRERNEATCRRTVRDLFKLRTDTD